MEILYSNLGNLTWQQVVMWAIGGLLVYLAIAKDMEPSLLLPMGFGAILVNLPMSGAVDQWVSGQLDFSAHSSGVKLKYGGSANLYSASNASNFLITALISDLFITLTPSMLLSH